MIVDHDRLGRYQAQMAPGTPFREGLDRILAGRTGALIAIGDLEEVRAVSTGGFQLDAAFTPTALRELSKMDGGLVVTADLGRIVRAGVHFAPDASIETVETGTRHASADRLAKQTGIPVVTVSASMSTIALYLDGARHVVQGTDALLARANQALDALGRYNDRLQEVTATLSALEVADQVTVRDVALVAQRLELVRRLAAEVRGYIRQLGVDGRLLDLQLHEATDPLSDLAGHLRLDYGDDAAVMTFDRLAELVDSEVVDLDHVARTLGFDRLDQRLSPRGMRQLLLIRRLPPALAPRLLDRFGGLQGLLAASHSDLREVDGVGEGRATLIRDELLRLTEAAYRLA